MPRAVIASHVRSGSLAAAAAIEPRGSYTPNNGHGSATRLRLAVLQCAA